MLTKKHALDPTKPCCCGHDLHELWPIKSWYVVTGHGVHMLWPVLEYFPAWQLLPRSFRQYHPDGQILHPGGDTLLG